MNIRHRKQALITGLCRNGRNESKKSIVSRLKSVVKARVQNIGLSGKFSRAQYICIAAAVILTAAAYLNSQGTSFLNEDGSISRSEPGSSDDSYVLNVHGIGSKDSSLTVNVSARQYTEYEAFAAFEEIMERMSAYICGDNDSLDEIRSDLKLKRSIPGYAGIRLSWYPDDTSLITDTGKVDNYKLTEAADTRLTVILKTGEYRQEYVLPITIYPAEAALVGEAELTRQLKEAITEADTAQLSEESLRLPDKLAGTSITYSEPEDRGWIRIPFLGAFAFILLGLKPEQDRRKQQKAREQELMLDYSDIVSKLAIYIGAGMTAANAWLKICDNYLEAVGNGSSGRRAAYEEMLKSAGELKQGVSETKVYSDFAGRCSLSCYLKLSSLLEQNRKTGDSRLRTALISEAREAFEQRKNTAKQLGEEAGTKLMVPLIISLVTVMITVAVPAMMTML